VPRKAAAEELVFFVDRSLGGKLVVEAMRNVGAEVIAHDDAFDQNATDVEWLAEAGRRGWVVDQGQCDTPARLREGDVPRSGLPRVPYDQWQHGGHGHGRGFRRGVAKNARADRFHQGAVSLWSDQNRQDQQTGVS